MNDAIIIISLRERILQSKAKILQVINDFFASIVVLFLSKQRALHYTIESLVNEKSKPYAWRL
jgi:hypothetical protein